MGGKNLRERYERYKKEHPDEETIRDIFSPIIENLIIRGFFRMPPVEEERKEEEKKEEEKKEKEIVEIRPEHVLQPIIPGKEEIERALQEVERELREENEELELLKQMKQGDELAKRKYKERRRRRVRNVALDTITREILRQIKLPKKLYVPYYAIVYSIVRWFLNTYKGIREWDEIDWASLDWGIIDRTRTVHGYPHEMAEHIKREILEKYPIPSHIKEERRSLWDMAMEELQHHTNFVDDLLYKARGGDEDAKKMLEEAYGITIDMSDEEIDKRIEEIVCKEFNVRSLDELKGR